MSTPFSCFSFDGAWLFTRFGAPDPNVTRAVYKAMSRLAHQSERSNTNFILGYLNHDFDPAAPDAVISEGWSCGNLRLQSYLCEQGFDILPAGREDDADWVNPGTGKNHSRLSMHLQSLDRVFTDLRRQGLRGIDAPTKIEGWAEKSQLERRALKELIYGSNADDVIYNGMQFVPSAVADYAIRIEDPRGLGARMIAAAERDRWCPAALCLLHAIKDEGGRFNDTAPTTALDWWMGDKFKTLIECPLKGSRGERRGRIAITQETRRLLIESFDADPARPDFTQLEHLAKHRQFEELDSHFLFPSSTLRPFSSHNFITGYVEPTMRRHEVTITSRCGTIECIATLHRLRAASIQSDVESAFAQFELGSPGLANELQAIQEDHHLRSRKAFRRYLGQVIQELSQQRKRGRSEARTARIGKNTVFDECRHHNGQHSPAAARQASFA